MMFDKDLFLSICEKYGVELSKSATSPMINDGMGIHAVTNDDVQRIFSPLQTYFEYSSDKINAKVVISEFYLQENYAIAC